MQIDKGLEEGMDHLPHGLGLCHLTSPLLYVRKDVALARIFAHEVDTILILKGRPLMRDAGLRVSCIDIGHVPLLHACPRTHKLNDVLMVQAAVNSDLPADLEVVKL